jgi:predicted short-subunit dehydrogenase-like oxidoreductase (DUF2520 family)
MRIILVGPGRAGLSLSLAARAAGHDIRAVVGRTLDSAQAGIAIVGGQPLTPDVDLPEADLLLLATRDEAIGAVAAQIAPHAGAVASAVHISGLAPVTTLDPLAEAGLATGSFHPLQTLPNPETGAARISGAWIAVTAAEPLKGRLVELARSVGASPFDIDDAHKPLYHAAAAAAANFPLAALTMASDLFEAAGVPFDAARPLVEAVVGNAFDIGPRPALTGPVARGDVDTVRAQLDAVAAADPSWLGAFAAFVRELARLTGRSEEFEEMLRTWEPG